MLLKLDGFLQLTFPMRFPCSLPLFSDFATAMPIQSWRLTSNSKPCYTSFAMKIYLDACCLNRPFDDQRQPRVRLEAEAVSLILQKFHQREWEWIASEVLIYELGQTADVERRERLLLLAGQSHQVAEITEKILNRAETLEASGFDSYDAIHLASAEAAQVEVFLTTDDSILKSASRSKGVFSFLITNPVRWLEEVLK